MGSKTDETAYDQRYALRCVECSFETTVVGDVFDAFDVADRHQETVVDDASKHFVEFVLEEQQ